MKNQFRNLLGIMVLGFVLTGCQKKDDHTMIESRVESPRAGGLAPGGQTAPNSIGVTVNGYVSVNSSYQSDFQYVVADFLSSIMPENYVGFVSASVDQRTLSGQCPSPSYECGTGVFLGGRVDFVNGRLQASAGSRLDITGSSKLVIQVMDYIPNQPQIAPIPPIYLPNAEGFVQGNRAYLVFWDNYGFVYMEGQFDNQWFTGRIEYENYERYDGSPGNGELWTLGDFRVPTCQFFNCN